MENKTALNRVFINGTNSCFITLKDHRANILNNLKTCLLNPANNELGRISKVILAKINLNLRNATKVNQWKNTNDHISWFKCIKNKKNFKFISFNIKNFYPKTIHVKNTAFTFYCFKKKHISLKLSYHSKAVI